MDLTHKTCTLLLCWWSEVRSFGTLIVRSKRTLRMSATGRSFTQIFFQLQYIIIEAILTRKLMKKFTVTNEKILHVCKTFNHKK